MNTVAEQFYKITAHMKERDDKMPLTSQKYQFAELFDFSLHDPFFFQDLFFNPTMFFLLTSKCQRLQMQNGSRPILFFFGSGTSG